MVEKTLLGIRSSFDLKDVKVGDIISIKGKSPEVVINPEEEFKDYKFSEIKNWKPHNIYTVGVEKPFVVLNQYDKYHENSDEFLVPYFKTSCRMFSGTSLEESLMRIVNREGLKNA
jgi:hypothetical protein